MKAEPIFGALNHMEKALRQAESEVIKAAREGNESLQDWLENFVSITRVWLDQWREVVSEANRPPSPVSR